MIRPGDKILEAVAPFYDIDGLPPSDNDSVRNVAHAETRNSLRLPRGGTHEATLVAVRRYYDGANGGEAGEYLMVWVEFRATSSRWRTSGLKIRAAEAARIARDMAKGKPSKPSRTEPTRVSGREQASDDSELRGASVAGGGYVVFVRHLNRAGAWARTRGVEVLPGEVSVLVTLLKQLAKGPQE